MELIAVSGELLQDKYPSHLSRVAAEIIAFRKEAVECRMSSGIEQKWAYCEDAYAGEDEATRSRVNVLKPSTLDGAFILNRPEGWQRSTAFMNVTRPYVDTAAAHVGNILFPSDDKNWDIRPTPKQDIEELLTGAEIQDEAQAAEVMQIIEQMLRESLESVEKAERQIDDWLNETQWNSLGRDLLLNAARTGTGVVKGPVPGASGSPQSKVIDVQNLFPDPNCGEDIHQGEYLLERDEVVARILRKKASPGAAKNGWIPSAVVACLKEGPKTYNGALLTTNGKPSRLYELWYFQGEIPVEALREIGRTVPSDAEERIWVNATVCNDHIVRIGIAPQQSRFSYDVFRWQKRKNHWAGIGVAEQLETSQRGLNAAIRNLFDNAALSALPQLVYWKGILEPANGRFELVPGKLWQVGEGEWTVDDVKKAFMTIDIPSKQDELMKIFAMLEQTAQTVTGLPLIIQGQGSTGAVGSDQLQTNAATSVLRRLALEFDSRITIPHLTAYYEWMKEYGPIQVVEAKIDARGSSVLVERDIQAQALIQAVQLSKDPAYGHDPKLVFDEWLRSQKFDPRKTRMSPEREREMQELLSQPDEKAQASVESAQVRAQALADQAKTEQETDLAELQLKYEEAERTRQFELEKMDRDYRYKIVEFAIKNGLELDTALTQAKMLESTNSPRREE